ncbi:hypothetical protein E2C00_17425 [Streptomyces sp. WAC05374]|uniref:hypothetical protein n=1 Tax=Streptomyces sp. WAC05374 TaxID=2487420 RepID=UPI000F89566D|nr:hypothetical protein [Streptomyces sp. WAC05374]RST13584.1 hypothetical protein EF905_20025 [Streptomyces sp. WAC05374]TDF54689.1 hypothetical protein E2C00_17425 [Streptomyces sp. WAC05374]TDF56325.1 hypothetical protein E2C02_12880 [Streptomyces sp. WAC05374]
MTAVNPSVEALLADIPALVPYVRQATLLRPEAGRPTALESHVGGPLLWPADEEWPVCPGPHLVEVREKLSDEDREAWQRTDRAMRDRRAGRPNAPYEVTHEEAGLQARIMDGANALDMITWERIRRVPVPAVPGVPLIGVLQLRAQDVPALEWPEGTDVLQVLWCPRDHTDLPGQSYYYGPAVEVRHRSAALVGTLLEPPVPSEAVAGYVPQPCLLDPIQVTDLPDQDELPEDLFDQAEAWAEDRDTEYHRVLSCREGWKAGGWPSWHLTDLVPVDCPACGTRTRLFLTVDSGHDPDLNVGRYGELRVFTCPADAAHPIRLNIQ